VRARTLDDVEAVGNGGALDDRPLEPEEQPPTTTSERIETRIRSFITPPPFDIYGN
jgi:hypothetical protein